MWYRKPRLVERLKNLKADFYIKNFFGEDCKGETYSGYSRDASNIIFLDLEMSSSFYQWQDQAMAATENFLSYNLQVFLNLKPKNYLIANDIWKKAKIICVLIYKNKSNRGFF